MAARNVKISRKDATALNIPVGTPMFIEPAGLGERFKSAFVGMERDRFIIARIPRIPGVGDHLYVEKGITVRFLHEGNVFGFETEVLWVATTPFRLLFLRFPLMVEALNLRECQRLECYLPSVIKIGEEWHESMILNVSCGGCQVVVEGRDGNNPPAVVPDQVVMLDFKIFGQDTNIMIGGKAKSVDLSKSRLYLGIKFDEMPEQTAGLLNNYIERVSQYLDV